MSVSRRYFLSSDSRVLHEYLLSPLFEWSHQDKCEVVILSNFGIASIPADHFIFNFGCLRKLDLSCNRMQILPSASSWQSLSQLEVLYLHNNFISRFSDVFKLKGLHHLQYLTLYDNPISIHSEYRSKITWILPSLRALDTYVISDAEMGSEFVSAKYAGKFSPLSPLYNILKPEERLASVFQGPSSSVDHCVLMDMELREISRLFIQRNPAAKVQRAWKVLRQNLVKSRFINSKNTAALDIQRVFRGFRTRRDLTPRPIMHESKAIMLIQKHYRLRRARRLALSMSFSDQPVHFLCSEDDIGRVLAIVERAVAIVGAEKIRSISSIIGRASQDVLAEQESHSPSQSPSSHTPTSSSGLRTPSPSSFSRRVHPRDSPSFLNDNDFASGLFGFGKTRSANSTLFDGHPDVEVLSRARGVPSKHDNDAVASAHSSRPQNYSKASAPPNQVRQTYYTVKTSDLVVLRKSQETATSGLFAHVFAHGGNFVCRGLLHIRTLKDYLDSCSLILDPKGIARYAKTFLRPRYRCSGPARQAFTTIVMDELENERYREFFKEVQIVDPLLASCFLQLIRDSNIAASVRGSTVSPIVLYQVSTARKVGSTVTIQAAWRSHVARTRLRPPLIDRILQHRAAMLLQARMRCVMSRVRTRMLLACVYVIRKFRAGCNLIIPREHYQQAFYWDEFHKRSIDCIPESHLSFGFSPSNWLVLRDASPLPFWLRAWLPEAAEEEDMFLIKRSPHPTWWCLRWGAQVIELQDDDGRQYVMFVYESMQETVARALMFTIRTFLFATCTSLPLLTASDIDGSAFVRRTQQWFRRYKHVRERVKLALERQGHHRLEKVQGISRMMSVADLYSPNAPRPYSARSGFSIPATVVSDALESARSVAKSNYSASRGLPKASSVASPSSAPNSRPSTANVPALPREQAPVPSVSCRTSPKQQSHSRSSSRHTSPDSIQVVHVVPVPVAKEASRDTTAIVRELAHREREFLSQQKEKARLETISEQNRIRQKVAATAVTVREKQQLLRTLDTGPNVVGAVEPQPDIIPETVAQLQARTSKVREELKSAVSSSRERMAMRKLADAEQVRRTSFAAKTAVRSSAVLKAAPVPSTTSRNSKRANNAPINDFAQLRNMMSRQSVLSDLAVLRNTALSEKQALVAQVKAERASRKGSQTHLPNAAHDYWTPLSTAGTPRERVTHGPPAGGMDDMALQLATIDASLANLDESDMLLDNVSSQCASLAPSTRASPVGTMSGSRFSAGGGKPFLWRSAPSLDVPIAAPRPTLPLIAHTREHKREAVSRQSDRVPSFLSVDTRDSSSVSRGVSPFI